MTSEGRDAGTWLQSGSSIAPSGSPSRGRPSFVPWRLPSPRSPRAGRFGARTAPARRRGRPRYRAAQDRAGEERGSQERVKADLAVQVANGYGAAGVQFPGNGLAAGAGVQRRRRHHHRAAGQAVERRGWRSCRPSWAAAISSAARVDPDGRGIRLGLGRKLTVNSMEAGEKLFIDLLPDGWTGLPPGLPQEVVDELAKRAWQAEKRVRQLGDRINAGTARRQAARRRGADLLAIRLRGAGRRRDPDPSRRHRLHRAVQGRRGARFRRQQGPSAAGGHRRSTSTTGEKRRRGAAGDGAGRGRAHLPRGEDVLGRRDAAQGRAGRAPPRRRGRAQGEARIARRSSARAPAPIAGQLEQLIAAAGAEAEPATPPPQAAQRRAGDASTEAAAPPARRRPRRRRRPPLPHPSRCCRTWCRSGRRRPPGRPSRRRRRAEADPPPRPAAGGPAARRRQGGGTAAAAPRQGRRASGRAPGTVVADMVRQGGGAQAQLPVHRRRPPRRCSGAARCCGWCSTPTRRSMSPTLANDKSGTFREVQASQTDTGIGGADAAGAAVAGGCGSAGVRLEHLARRHRSSNRPSRSPRPRQLVDGRSVLSLPLEGAHRVHRLTDPDAGDLILAATAPGPTRGIPRNQDYVEFSLIATTHGVAVLPIADDLAVEAHGRQGDGVAAHPGWCCRRPAWRATASVARAARPVALDPQLWGAERTAAVQPAPDRADRGGVRCGRAATGGPRGSIWRGSTWRRASPPRRAACSTPIIADGVPSDDAMPYLMRAMAWMELGRNVEAMKDLGPSAAGHLARCGGAARHRPRQ